MKQNTIHLHSTEAVTVVPAQTKLLLTLWTLANRQSFQGFGDRIGMYMGLYQRN